MKLHRHFMSLAFVFLLMLPCTANESIRTAAKAALENVTGGRLGKLYKVRAQAETSERREMVIKACVAGLYAIGDASNALKIRRELSDEDFLEEFMGECDACKGGGVCSRDCYKCKGTGKCQNWKCNEGMVSSSGFDGRNSTRKCSTCGGTGACANCKGKGSVGVVCRGCNGVKRIAKKKMALAFCKKQLKSLSTHEVAVSLTEKRVVQGTKAQEGKTASVGLEVASSATISRHSEQADVRAGEGEYKRREASSSKRGDETKEVAQNTIKAEDGKAASAESKEASGTPISRCRGQAAVRVREDEYRIGGCTWKYTIDNGAATINYFSGRRGEKNIAIPKKINGYPVDTIGTMAFQYRDIESFDIPEFITKIEGGAFFGCKGLASITISKNVKDIGGGAFLWCEKLMQISVDPDNANYATVNGALLTKDKKVLVAGINGDVLIPDTVRSIGKSAFNGYYGLTSVTIPKSVIEIGDSAFNGCKNLKEITIPMSVKSIGKEAFKGVKRIKVDDANLVYASENGLLLSKDKKTLICGEVVGNFVLPNSVTEISDEAFEWCTGLNNVTIGPNVRRIGKGAFAHCGNLTSVTIGPNVRRIGKGAFADCRNLTNVTIPDSVTEIGEDAFEFCARMTNVRIGKGLKVIPRNAFLWSGLENVEIPNSVTRVEGFAFDGCTNLVHVKLDKNTTHVADSAFKGCNKLVRDGFVIVCEKLYEYSGPGGSVVIPDKTTAVGANAFRNCAGLVNITIPDSVTEIGDFAFYGCDALTIVEIGKGVRRVGAQAFSSCGNLRQIKVDKGNSTYASEDGLLLSRGKDILIFGRNGDVAIPETVLSIRDGAFLGFKGLKDVVLPGALNDIGACAFAGCINLRGVTLPDSLTSIGDEAFLRCNIKEVKIPNSVTSIGEGAFRMCRNLTAVTIGDGVENVEKDAFAWCWALKKISIPEAFASEIPSIFSNCPILDEVGRGDAWIDMRPDIFSYRKRYIEEASRGVARAQYCLGMCYIAGKGVEKNVREGIRLLVEAAAQGHAGAFYQLGRCFYENLRNDNDIAVASGYWNEAAARGHRQAIFALNLIPSNIRIRNGRR